MLSFIIQGELTNLNTYINAERTNKFIASKIKKQETENIAWQCKKYKGKITEYPIVIEATWYTKNIRVDSDNITFSKKFILDGMKEAGMITDDSRKFVRVWKDLDVCVDKNNPRIEITIHENM